MVDDFYLDLRRLCRAHYLYNNQEVISSAKLQKKIETTVKHQMARKCRKHVLSVLKFLLSFRCMECSPWRYRYLTGFPPRTLPVRAGIFRKRGIGLSALDHLECTALRAVACPEKVCPFAYSRSNRQGARVGRTDTPFPGQYAGHVKEFHAPCARF